MKDSQATLQERIDAALALFKRKAATLHRRTLNGTTFVGVTGSFAKTTTVAMIARVLPELGPGRTGTPGNNDLRDILRTVRRTRRGDRYCLEEISGHRPGAIGSVLPFFRPDIGVVTWIGSDHWKQFGSENGILEEKAKLVEALPAGGTAVLNADDPAVLGLGGRARARVLTYGLAENANVRAVNVESAFPERLSLDVVHRGESARVRTRLVGEHLAYPVLAAVAVGIACGMPLARCARCLEDAEPSHHRLSVHPVPCGAVFLCDTRKSSLATFDAAFRVLEKGRARRKTAVIGTISYYHGTAATRYRRIAERAFAVADRVYSVGDSAEHARKAAASAGGRDFRMFPDALAAHEHLAADLGDGDLVLLKGGIADHLERLMEAQAGDFACWRDRCGRRHSCTWCPERAVSSLPGEPAAAGEAARPATEQTG